MFVILNGSVLAQPVDFRTAFSSNGRVSAMAFDKSGNIYVAGSTQSVHFPTTPGAFQTVFRPSPCGGGPTPGSVLYCPEGFIAKLDPTGSRLIYSTLIGGNGTDRVSGIQVLENGNVWFTGGMSSPGLPVSPNAWRREAGPVGTHGFVGLLNATGSQVIYGTYTPSGAGTAVQVAPNGDVIVVGDATSTQFEITPGSFRTQRDPLAGGTPDVFALRLSSDLSQLRWSSAFGGSAQDSVVAMGIDATGDILLSGNTGSTGPLIPAETRFPVTPGAVNRGAGGGDFFACKLSGNGATLRFCAVWGGAGYDALLSAELTPDGALLWAGQAARFFAFPITENAYRATAEGAVAGRLAADGSRLEFSTNVGQEPRDYAQSIQRAPDGTILIYGQTHSANYPTSPGAERGCFGGEPRVEEGQSTFVLRLSADGASMLYSSFLPYRIQVGQVNQYYTVVPWPEPSGILRRASVDPPWSSQVTCLANAASYRQRGLVPGSIITVLGQDIGPASASGPVLSADQRVATTLGNTRVRIGGIAAPLLYVSRQQINAIVPSSLVGPADVLVEVERDGRIVDSFRRIVIPAAPALFVADGSGRGPVAAINQDGTLNSAVRPAPRGSILSLYLTGTGVPEGVPLPDGSLAPGAGGTPRGEVRVRFNTVNGEVLYAGYSPGQVAGLTQVNVKVPDQAGVTGQVVIDATVNGNFADNLGELRVWVQ